MSAAKATTDHDEIRRWAEERGGKPVTVRSTMHGDEPGVLRIDFPGYAGEDSFEEVTWDEWFQKFDESNLAALYQDETSDGKTSRFLKLVDRASVEEE
jgi:hypothetical protein